MGLFSRIGSWLFGSVQLPPPRPIRARPARERYPEASGMNLLPRRSGYQDQKRDKIPSQASPPYIQTLSIWTIDSALAAVNEHERGNMNRSGLLWKWMLRDDRLKTVMNVRCSGINSLPFSVLPASEEAHTPEEEAAALQLKAGWRSSFPQDLERAILRIAVGMGVVVGHISWVPGKFGYWWPKLTLWPEEAIRWDDALQCWWALTREGGEQMVTPGDGHWFLWEPDGARGFQLGAVMALCLPVLITAYDWQDWVNYNDAHGRPIRKVVIPRGASPTEVATFLANVKALGRTTSSILCRRQLVPEDMFDFMFVTPDGDVVDTFERSLAAANTAKATLILGQTLTTEVATGGNGATSTVHQQIKNQILMADAEGLAQAIRSQIIHWWAIYNLGNARLAPRPHWDAMLPEDTVQKTLAQKNIGDALTSLRNGLKGTGQKLKVKEWAKEFKIPIEDGDDAGVAPLPAPTPIKPDTPAPAPAKLAA